MRDNNTITRGRRDFLKSAAAGILGGGAISVGPGTSAVNAWTGMQTNSVLNQARSDSSPLKIRSVTPMILQLQRDSLTELKDVHFLLCRIQTEDGITGWGDGSSWGKVAPIYSEIERAAPYVVGQSAWNVERIWQATWSRRGSSLGASVQSSIAAMDCALWDIVGQKLNVPVYKLLGGKLRDRIRIYTSYRWGRNIERTREAYAKRTRELVAEGAVAGKYDPFFDRLNADRQVSLKTLRELEQMVQGIREGGPDFDICIEGHGKFNVGSAITIAKVLEPFHVLFFEEPVTGGNATAMREVQRATSVSLAAGERMQSRLQAREFIETDALRILQPDATRCGGITELRKIAEMADTHFMTVAPHNPNTPVCTAAHLHLSAAMSNFLILEEGARNPKMYAELFGSWDDNAASWAVPERPGLGITISDAVIKEYGVPLERSH
ncbi:MAG TPA: mandelate racemase/muconate lactonizing enzyme family protein [Bryobacteraceae bacterium]|nr:mandelate racemase/muconate lactonizing enzyme family protein [Bryobacteraceae bacterium]